MEGKRGFHRKARASLGMRGIVAASERVVLAGTTLKYGSTSGYVDGWREFAVQPEVDNHADQVVGQHPPQRCCSMLDATMARVSSRQ